MSIRKVVPIDQAEWWIAPVPEWVERREPDWQFVPPDGHAVAFLLFDVQHHVATQACTTRTVRRLFTLAAVQALAQVELEFDPAAHRLLIHELAVWRAMADGRWEKRSLAKREAFLLRQREQQLEQQMLNGRVSVVALLEDVRVGDAIELASTLEPRDRLPGLSFAEFFAFAWSVSMARVFFTLHLSTEHPVRWCIHAPDGVALPAESSTPRNATWSVEHPPIFVPEPNVPGGHWPFALLDVSGWTTWSQVAQYMAGLWDEALTEGSGEIAAEAARLRTGEVDADGVRAAIRFVQEEIRYLAVDFGHGGGVLPNGAASVLRRRFGDCKDKAVLLTALLRALGIEAWPLLVGAGWREAVERVQPSTAAFSHAIVTFRANGKRYFADPTTVGQGGDLTRLVAPPFGCGLEVRRDAEGLLRLPELSAAELTLTETFQLDHSQRDGSVEQVLRASAWLANDVRAALVRQGRGAFFKARAEELQKHFPALTAVENAVTVDDDADQNVIELRARYALPTWGRPGEKPPVVFRYGAHGLFLAVEHLEGPEQRRQPWALRFPLTVAHRVVVHGKCVRKTRPEYHEVVGPAFRYSCDVSARRHEVAFEYRWETTQREVAPREWTEYCRERNVAFESAGANVTTAVRSRAAWTGVWVAALAIMVLAIVTKRERNSPRGVTPRPPSAVELQQHERDLRAAVEAARRGDYLRAESLVEGVQASYARSFEYQILRADVALHTGHFERARGAIVAARKLDAASSVPDLLEAIRLENLGEFGAARELLDRVLAHAPNDPYGLFNLARLTERMGETAAARSAWEKFLALQPAQPDALLHYALLLWRGGERERADAAIVGAIRSQPAASAPLESALSQYYAATLRQAEAIAPARRAADLAPDDPVIARRHVMALERAGDNPGALAAARTMLERFPKHPAAWSALALAAARAGETETAERAYRSWLELAPGDSGAYANYGFYLIRAGRALEARALLEKATRDFPGHGPVWMNYGAALAALGETQAAAEATRKADTLLTAEERAGELD